MLSHNYEFRYHVANEYMIEKYFLGFVYLNFYGLVAELVRPCCTDQC